MKITHQYLLSIPLAAAVFLSGFNNPVKSQEDFTIEDIKIQIYDNQNNIIIDSPTNGYGNGMDIFLSVLIVHSVELDSPIPVYRVTVEGYGKGRENDAEGLVEDYRVKETKEVIIYGSGYGMGTDSQYVPFILEYPCTEEATYTITVVEQGTNNIATKKIQSPHSFCYFN